MTPLATPVNETSTTIAAGTSYTRGTDVDIFLTDHTDFPNSEQGVRISDGAHFALLIYTSKTAGNPGKITLPSATSYARARNVSPGGETHTFPAGSLVELVALADMPAQLMNELDKRVTGPTSAVNNNLPAFDNTTGKLIKDSGNLSADVADAVLKRVLIGDIFSPFVSSGLTATVVGTDNKVTITPGVAYNTQRLETTTDTVLTVTNTGAIHTEYVSVNTSGALIITTTPRAADELAVANVSVNAAGVATGVTDVRQLKLHLKTAGIERLTVDKDGNLGIGGVPLSKFCLEQTTTITSGWQAGSRQLFNANPSVNSNADMRALFFQAKTDPSATINFTGRLMGMEFSSWHRGTGALTTLEGIMIFAGIDAAAADPGGTITTAKLLNLVPTKSKGTINTFYGLFVDSIAGKGTVTYPIYVIDGNSYFGGNLGIRAVVPGANLHLDDETTTATKVLFQVESDVTTADTIKARIEADGEMFSDIGFTTFSPEVSDDPKEALQQALTEANKPNKPYTGFVPDEKYIAEVEKAEKQQRKALRETAKQLLECDKKCKKEKGDKLKELQEQKKQLLESQKQQQAECDKIKKQVVNLKKHKATALKHGIKNLADEKTTYGKDVSKIAIGLARYCQQLEERCKQFESRIAKLEKAL